MFTDISRNKTYEGLPRRRRPSEEKLSKSIAFLSRKLLKKEMNVSVWWVDVYNTHAPRALYSSLIMSCAVHFGGISKRPLNTWTATKALFWGNVFNSKSRALLSLSGSPLKVWDGLGPERVPLSHPPQGQPCHLPPRQVYHHLDGRKKKYDLTHLRNGKIFAFQQKQKTNNKIHKTWQKIVSSNWLNIIVLDSSSAAAV